MSIVEILLIASPAGLLAGILGAMIGAQIARRAATAHTAEAAAAEARLVVLDRRTTALEQASERQAGELSLRCRQVMAKMRDVANVLTRLAEQSKKLEGAAAKRSELVVQRLTEQVEGLADRVFDLDARVARIDDHLFGEGGAQSGHAMELSARAGVVPKAGGDFLKTDETDTLPSPFPVYEPADGPCDDPLARADR